VDPGAILAAALLGLLIAYLAKRYGERGRRPATPPPKAPPAKDAPAATASPFVTFQGDGSIVVHTGGGAELRIGAAMPEPDGGEPRRDALVIARDVAKLASPSTSLPRLVDAAWLLARHGASVKVNAERRPIVALVATLAEADGDGVRRALRELGDDVRGWSTAGALVGSAMPELVFEEALRAGVTPGWQVVRAIARTAPERLREPLASIARPDLLLARYADAVIAAAEAKREDAVLLEGWRALGEARASDAAKLLEWRDAEVERLAHVDLEAACALWRLARDEWATPELSTVPLLTVLAKHDPERARAWLADERERSPEPFDWLPFADGCAHGGLDVADALAAARERIHASAYRPAAVFGTLVRMHLRAERLDALEEVLRAGGAHRWQTALYAHEGVRELARKGSSALPRALDLVLACYEPGPVAARDASAGFVAGHAMMRPPELALPAVHPSELVVLASALTEAAPEHYLAR
jgi:hypothetical protein